MIEHACFGHCISRLMYFLPVTNPFFLRECKDWPHKLILSSAGFQKSAPLTSSAPLLNNSGGRAHSSKSTSLQSKYKCMLPPGHSLLEELIPLKGSKGNAGDSNWRDVNDAIARSNNRVIRRHFFERTQQFLVPVESYFTSLMPVIPSSVMANGAMQDAESLIRCFDKAEFLKRVADQKMVGSLFEGKRAKRVDMYKRFLNSRTFDIWYFEKMLRTKAYLRK